MNAGNNNNVHTLESSDAIQTLDFSSGDSQQDVLNISQLLPDSGSGVNASNLKQFLKISSAGVFIDSAGAGQFSTENQVARFAAGNPPLNAMVAVQIADTSIIHFDRSVNADDPLTGELSTEDVEDLDELNEVTGTAQQDSLMGSASADVLYGGRGDDVLEGGAGNDVYVGGAGADRYVLTETDAVVVLDFKSTRFEKDVLDVSQLLPAGVDVNNLLSYLSITEEGVFLDEDGNGDFSEENQIARFTEDSIFSRNEILIDIGDNARVVFNIFAQAGVQLRSGSSFESNDVLISRTEKFDSLDRDGESGSGSGSDNSTAFIRSRAGELFNFRVDDHQVEEVHGAEGGEILDASQVAESTEAGDEGTAGYKLWMYGRDGNDTLMGNDDGVMLDGGRGNDRIVSGGGRNMLIGGEGQDEFVLTLETSSEGNVRSDLLYDFTSIEGDRDLIDLQNVLPEEATEGNIHSFLKITDTGVFVDVNGDGQFDESKQLARFGERVNIDDLIRIRLPDGEEVEFNRNDDSLSELEGSENGDQLHGGSGNDILRGLAGNDVLDGDGLGGSKSVDQLYGGEGNDQLIVDGLDLAFGVVDGGTGFDTVKLKGDTGESLSLDLAASGIERAFGSYSDDVLDGSGFTGPDGYNKNSGAYEDSNAQRIELFGKYGNDTLKGGIANDYLDGGYGDDVIAGGAGRDFMVGGSGNDTFVLSDDGEIDTLWDFKSTGGQQDVLDLSAFLPSSTSLEDLSRYIHVDNQFVYFDSEGDSQFNYSTAVAKFGGSSIIDEPVVISLGDGRVLSKEAGWSTEVVSTQSDGSFIITTESLIANSSLSSVSNVSVTNLSTDNGQLTDNGDGTWTLKPEAGFNSQLNLSYEVSGTTVVGDQRLFSTDFNNFSSAITSASELESSTGWQTDNPSDSVELHYETAYGGSDGSSRVIEVEGAVGDNNIFRNIATEAGRTYELNFDFSPREGVTSSGVDVYWGGERVAQLDGSSGQFNWQSQTMTLTGDGSDKRLEFRATSNEGAGGLLDNIELTLEGYEEEHGPVETSAIVSANTPWSADGMHIIADGIEDQVLRFTESDLLTSSGRSAEQFDVRNVDYEGSDGSLSEIAHIEFGSGADGLIQLDERLSAHDAFSIEFEYTSDGSHIGSIETVLSVATSSIDNMINAFIQNDDGSLHLYVGGSKINFEDLNLQDGETHTITMTWDSENGEVKVFDGGSLVANGSLKQGYNIPSGGWVIVGQDQDSYGGSMDSNQSLVNTQIGHVALSYDVVSQEDIESGSSIVEASSNLAFNVRAQNGEVVDTTNNFSVSTTGDVTAVHEYFEFTPTDDFAGNVSLSYDLSDGSSTVSSTGALSFAAVNDAPELNVNESGIVDGVFTVPEGSGNGALVGQATASDVDDPDSLAFSLSNDAGGRFAIDPSTGEITVADGALLDFETSDAHDITIQVSDGSLTSSQQITVQISDANEAPVVSEPVDLGVITEVDSIIITKAMLLANASDENGDELSIINLSSNNGVVVDNGNDSWTFTPVVNFTGSVSFSFDISDGVASTSASAALQVNDVVLGDNVVAAFGFRDTSDATGNGNTLTFSNSASVGTGRDDNSEAFEMDGTVGAAEISGLTTGGAMTVAAWVKYDSFDQSYSRIFDFGNGSDDKNILLAHQAQTNDLEFYIFSGGSDDPKASLIVSDFFSAGEWVHVAATVDSDGTMSVFKNGELAGQIEGVTPTEEARSGNFIGQSHWEQDGYLDGSIDDFIIFNEALDSDQISRVYQLDSLNGYAPESSDNNLILESGGSYNFSPEDFEFSDNDSGDTLQSVIITSLPVSGALNLNGTAVAADQVIAAADISNLSYTAPTIDSGVSNSFSFAVSDGSLTSDSQTFNLNVRGAYSDNLLTNASAEDGTSGWGIIQNGGNGWGKSGGSHDGDGASWATSYNWGKKSQTINLLEKGFTAEILDGAPTIDVSDWFQDTHSNDSYYLKVQLRDANNNVIASHSTGTLTAGNDWQEASHSFSDYGEGVRSIYFEHGGRDSENWAGRYGAKIDDSQVYVALENDESSFINGSDNAEIIQGSELNNVIAAGDGDDEIYGQLGMDIINGGDGNDTLIGGAGNDVMTGGSGIDVFSWLTADASSAGDPAEDVIADFQTGQGGDVLNLSDMLNEAEPLDDYLSFNFQDGSTTIDIKSSDTGDVTQKVTLRDVDLSNYGGGTSDIEIINNLIDDGNLQV